MLELLELGPSTLERLNAASTRFAAEHAAAVFVPRDTAVPAWEARLHAPVPSPPGIRDFYAFEQHVAVGYTRRGREIPRAWYEMPVFYFAHTGNLFGPNESVPKPNVTNELDFELELAAVIGRPGRDIPAADAWRHIAGFTIMNDWSARDIQRNEMSVGLGPAKGKDFATSFGPAIVTLDELSDRIDGDRIDLAMTAKVNDEPVSRDTSASMHWTFPQLIEAASRNADLCPGDLIGSGTCGTGCLFELGQEVHPWLQPGDEVELEIERIGRLRSTIVSPNSN
jgi:fumarylacetoacetate (FAA) hydrolase